MCAFFECIFFFQMKKLPVHAERPLGVTLITLMYCRAREKDFWIGWEFFFSCWVISCLAVATSKRWEKTVGECELGGSWVCACVCVCSVIKGKEAKVTAVRQCLCGLIKRAIHRCRPASFGSQADTGIEWGPGWPPLFVPSWPLLSCLAPAPLTWPVPLHR